MFAYAVNHHVCGRNSIRCDVVTVTVLTISGQAQPQAGVDIKKGVCSVQERSEFW